jgi:hypothetical protein
MKEFMRADSSFFPSAVDPLADWPTLLRALEEFCRAHGLDIEYDAVEDESCAIFYQEPPAKTLRCRWSPDKKACPGEDGPTELKTGRCV